MNWSNRKLSVKKKIKKRFHDRLKTMRKAIIRMNGRKRSEMKGQHAKSSRKKHERENQSMSRSTNEERLFWQVNPTRKWWKVKFVISIVRKTKNKKQNSNFLSLDKNRTGFEIRFFHFLFTNWWWPWQAIVEKKAKRCLKTKNRLTSFAANCGQKANKAFTLKTLDYLRFDDFKRLKNDDDDDELIAIKILKKCDWNMKN